MGDRDSSKTRVKPVFDKLHARDESGLSWVSELLKLPEFGGGGGGNFGSEFSPLEDHGWGEGEKRLAPPRVLLQWLASCAERPRNGQVGTSEVTIAKREALLNRDKLVIGEALALLSRSTLPTSDWYVLEGLSQPDVFLQTPEIVVVIEGKRTEAGPTVGTTWMPGRDQMIRHIDCAWEVRGSRKVLGFYIVEGEGGADAQDVPPHWIETATTMVAIESLEKSLPHRTMQERSEIMACFLGIATWQRVCARMGIDWDELPDRLVTR